MLALNTPLFDGAGVGAGGALLAGGSVGSGLGALTHPTLTAPAATAEEPDAGHAGVRARGAVTVLPLPARITLAETTVALPVI